MHKLYSAGMLLLVLFQVGGALLLFDWQRVQVRVPAFREADEAAPDALVCEIVVTPFNKTSVSWQRAGEFLYRGVMYDVLSTQVVNDTCTVYTCRADAPETVLLDNFFHYFHKSRQDGLMWSSCLRSFAFLVPPALPFLPWESSACAIRAIQKKPGHRDTRYVSPSGTVTQPPPEILFSNRA